MADVRKTNGAPENSIFNDGLLEPPAEGEKAEVKYPTIESIPVCDLVGGPQITSAGDYLTNPHEVWLAYKDGSYYVRHREPWEVETRQKEAKEAGKTGGVLNLFLPNSDELVQQIQVRNAGYQFETIDVTVKIVDGQPVPEGKPVVKNYQMCRSEKEVDEKGGHRIWIYEKNMLLERPCPDNLAAFFNALNSVNLTDVEMTKLVHLLKLNQKEYCISKDFSGNSEIAVTKGLLLDEMDDVFIPAIRNSGLFSEGRGDKIADALEKAFTRERDEKSAKSLTLATIIGASLAGTIVPVIAIAKQMKLAREQLELIKKQMGEGPKEPILGKMRNITEEAKIPDKLPPVSKHAAPTVKELVTELGKGQLANPVLLAENGVGKTAAVESLAQSIASGTLPDGSPTPENLKGAILIEINAQRDIMGQAGTEYRGKVEQRLTQIMDEANALAKKTGKRVILFFDEIHTLFNLGGTRDAPTGAEQSLKANMGRASNVSIIGATTPEEYARTIARDPAFASRMPGVFIKTPTAAEAVEIVKGIRPGLEKEFGRKLPDATIETAARLTEPVTYTNYPRKLLDLLRRVASEMKTDNCQESEITPEHVQRSFQGKYAPALAMAVDAAVAENQHPQLTPEQIEERQLQSIEKTLRERVKGYDQMLEAKRDGLIKTIFEAWRRAPAEAQGAMITAGTEPHTVPENFTELALERIKGPQSFEILPKTPVGGGHGGLPPTPPAVPPTPAAPPAPPAATPPAGPATPAASAAPETSVAQVLADAELKTKTTVAAVTKVGFAKGIGMTAVPAMAFDVAHAIGVPDVVTTTAGVGLGVAAVRAIGFGPVVEHGAAFMVGKVATEWLVGEAAKSAGLDSFKQGRLANKLVGDAAGGASWYALTKGGQLGARFLTKEALAAGGGAVASGGLLFIAQASMGSADEEDVALMLAGNANHRDPELAGLIRWAVSNEKFDINWHEADLDRLGLKGTENGDRNIMNNNRHFMQAFTALARAKETDNAEAIMKARKQFLDYFPELGTDQ